MHELTGNVVADANRMQGMFFFSFSFYEFNLFLENVIYIVILIIFIPHLL